MQAAFVDIGLERAAFIHAAEIGDGDANTPINQLVHEGQSLVVQVTKDPIGTKGARLTHSTLDSFALSGVYAGFGMSVFRRKSKKMR